MPDLPGNPATSIIFGDFGKMYCFFEIHGYSVKALERFISQAGIVPESGDTSMSRVCYFTGRRTTTGRSIVRRGKAKRHGGVGLNITGVTKRKFKPNIQNVRAIIDGKACRVKASAKAIRSGYVVKPVRRNYKPAEAAAR
jgi:large subunit ribosomal protein L28